MARTKSEQPQSMHQLNSRSKAEVEVGSKKIKRLRSLEPLLRDKKSSDVQLQQQKLPHYMRPTTSSDAKKERMQVNLQSSTISASAHDKSGTSKKFVNSNYKPAKTLTRKASLVPRQYSSKKTFRLSEPPALTSDSSSEPAKQFSRKVSFVVNRRLSFKKRLSLSETVDEEENLAPDETLMEKRTSPYQAKTLRRKASLLIRRPSLRTLSRPNPAKTLARTATLKLRRPSMKKRVGIVYYGKKSIAKATCSSTMKEVEFQKALNLNSKAAEAERTSLMKVCHFCYCSLNGHRHEHSSTLRRILSVKRPTLKSQKSIQLKRQLTIRSRSFRKGKIETKNLRTQKSIKLARQLTRRSRNLRGSNTGIISRKSFNRSVSKIASLIEELGEEINTAKLQKGFLGASYDRRSIRKILGPDACRVLDSLLPIEDDQTSDFTCDADDDLNLLESDDGENILPDFEYEHHEFSINEERSSTGAQEISSEEKVTDESKHPNCKENINEINECDNQHFKTLALQASLASPSETECETVESSLQLANCSSKISETCVLEQEVQSKETNHAILIDFIDALQSIVDISGTSESSEESTFVDKPAISSGEAVTEECTDHSVKLLMAERLNHDQLDATRIINHRSPNFLPENSDPDDEHVNLRHQTMEERKDADAWMTDHALQEMVTMLVPLRNLKVPMIVEAYEVVMPAVSDSESTLSPPVLDFAAQE